MKSVLDYTLSGGVANVIIVLLALAVIWYLVSEWFDHIKNPQTRVVTIVTTVITTILLILIYNNPEYVQSFLK